MRFSGLVSLRLSSMAAALCGMAAGIAHAQAPQVLPYTMSTYAGPHATYTPGAACGSLIALDAQGDGCLASAMSVGVDPHDVRVDGKGFVYFIDNVSSALTLIHKINPLTGQVTVQVGSSVNTKVCAGAADKYGDGCVATDGAANNNPADLHTMLGKNPRGMTVAPNGDIYTAGYNDNQIHRVNVLTGIYNVFAGTGTAGYTDAAAASALFSAPRGVGVDASGNVFVADTANNVIREISGGVVTTITKTNSSGNKVLGDPQLASNAQVNAPEDVQVDKYGNLYIADAGNAAVRAIYMGKGTLPGISNPQTGYIYTIAGGVTAVSGTTYYTAGTSTPVAPTALPITVRKLALDLNGNVYIADSSNQMVWFVDAVTGYVRAIAGYYGQTPSASPNNLCAAKTDAVGDGCPGVQAQLWANSNMGTSPDNQGNLYITDYEGGAPTSRIRKLLSGLNFPVITAGSGTVTQTVWVHFAKGDAPAASTPFTISGTDFTVGTPSCTTNSSADNTTDCYVPVTFTPSRPGYDTATLTVKSVSNGSSTYLLTGTGTTAAVAFDPGHVTALTATTTKSPSGVAADANGNSYIADTGNNRVLMVSASGTTTVIAGTGTAGYTGDGSAATSATLNGPTAVALDTDGNLYIADTGNNVVRKVAVATGLISTYAGGASSVCAAASNAVGDNCPATQAKFSKPAGIVADKAGNLYVADMGNNVIRQVNVFGWISTLGGGGSVCARVTDANGNYLYGNTDTQGDSCPALASIFQAPQGLAYDATGSYIEIADTGDSLVRRIYLGNSFILSGSTTTYVLQNPVTAVAGNGQAGSSVDANNTATLSQLNRPQDVAVDAAENVYIADTGNAAIRLVNPASGSISTIVGILASPGAGSVPGLSSDVTLNSPAGVAVLPNGNLVIADTGNNRVLGDTRASASNNFGRILVSATSSPFVLAENSVGTAAANATVNFNGTGDTADFAVSAPSGSSGCSGSLAPGAQCALSATFTPAAVGNYSATFTQNATGAANPPTITLTGTGAILTPTTSTVAQTSPATGNAQYGQALTLTVTVGAVCGANPYCTPTGTVRILVDGNAGSSVTLGAAGTVAQSFTGLSAGAHTVSCQYSGDSYYAASACTPATITVVPATTTSAMTLSANNQPQFATTVLTATVTSNVAGTYPTGSVTFYANGSGLTNKTLGTAQLNSTGVAAFTLQQVLYASGLINTDNTLPPGTYTITCSYSGAANFATSNCPGITLTVVAQAPGITLVTRGCSVQSTAPTVTGTPNQAQACQPSHGSSSLNETLINGIPAVTTAQGSVTDAAIFVTPTDTVAGTLTFSCAGLPAHSACTFSPTSIPLTAGTAYVPPIPVDVTFWTDVQPTTTSEVRGGKTGIELAMILGWPLTIAGMGGLFFTRRKRNGLRLLAMVPLGMLLAGGSLVMSGCAGPGDYVPTLTPPGQYLVTITVSGANSVKATTQVYFVVTSPGITGIQ